MLLFLNIIFANLYMIKVANSADPNVNEQFKTTLMKVDNPVTPDSGNRAALLKIAQLVLELASKQETQPPPPQSAGCSNCCHKGSNVYPATQCKNGFVLLGYRCYAVISKPMTWQEALDTCRGLGATLAQPIDGEEDRLLTYYIGVYYRILPGPATQIWIGGTDVNSPGTWVWANSNTKIQRTFWGPGEPNSQNEHCLTYATYYGSIMWNDAPCDFKLRSICQQ